MKVPTDFRKTVEKTLSKAGFDFEAQVSAGGVRPDFLVQGPKGQLVVVEAKSWDAKPGFVSRAGNQAKLYQQASGADGAILVLSSLKRNRLSEGVVTLEGLVDALNKEFDKPGKQKIAQDIQSGKQIIFVAMPFAPEYDDAYFLAMAPAAKKIGAACDRLDQKEYTGDVVARIHQSIKDSVAVIADLSESKPNVLYEAGYAHALNRTTIHICSTSLSDLPFDVRNWNTIIYKKGQVHLLKGKLESRLRAIVG